MPVDNQHYQYDSHCEIWRKCRDVANGQEAMQETKRREIYLPKLKNETPVDYAARLARTVLFNATWRTVQALVGMLMRKDPTVKVSAKAEPLLLDVTQTGLSLKDVVKEIATESLIVGRIGLLVDYPQTQPGEEYTVQVAQSNGLRPKMALYLVEDIPNWACGWVNNEYRLTLVVLRENCCYQDPLDEFTLCTKPQWRVLDLFPEFGYNDQGEPQGTFVMRVRLFEKASDGKSDLQVGDEIYPLMNGAKIPYITFVFISSDTTRSDVQLPPLIDLVNMNISHYQSTADVEHGAHKTALPQPYGTGIDKDEGGAAPTFYMGGGDMWLAPSPDAAFGMLEYTGQGLAAIETRLVRKEAQMAVLGARMLEDQKKGVETAEVAGMHRSGEQSALTTQGDTIDAGMKKALSWFDQWAGGDGKIEFATNKDFLPATLSAQEVTALMGAWQGGGMSDQELFASFKAGGVIGETQDFETHEAQILNGAPKLNATPAAAPVVEE